MPNHPDGIPEISIETFRLLYPTIIATQIVNTPPFVDTDENDRLIVVETPVGKNCLFKLVAESQSE